jgi:O-antigen/teichoic acid export membrane protein
MNAYFYVSWMIAGVIFMIPSAISQSLFAESSTYPNQLVRNTVMALKFSFALVIPAIVLLYIFADELLMLFGINYVNQSVDMLRLLGSSSILYVIFSIYVFKLNVEARVGMILILSVVMATATLSTTYVFLVVGYIGSPTSLGLLGIAYGWFSGLIIALILIGIDYLWHKKKINVCYPYMLHR